MIHPTYNSPLAWCDETLAGIMSNTTIAKMSSTTVSNVSVPVQLPALLVDRTAQMRLKASDMFQTTSNRWTWLLITPLLTVAPFLLYHYAKIPTISTKRIAWTIFLVSSVARWPFLHYALTGKSWTGMGLSAREAVQIKIHAISMSTWVVLATIQVVSAIGGFRRTHRLFGKLALFALVPIIVTELNANAGQVFLPDKPYALAEAQWGTRNASLPEVLALVPTASMALLTPVMICMYWSLGIASLYGRYKLPNRTDRLRVHILMMGMLTIVMDMPGIARWFIDAAFDSMDCPRFADPRISTKVQHIGAIRSGFISPVAVALYYKLALPDRLLTGPDALARVKISFLVYIAHSLLQMHSAWAVGFALSEVCVPESVEAFVAQELT